MRRDAVIRLAIPRRKLQHADIRREEIQRARKLRHARPVAADDGKTDRRLVRLCGDGACEVGNDQPLRAFGNVGKRDGLAGRKPLGERTRLHHDNSAGRNALMRSTWPCSVACSILSVGMPSPSSGVTYLFTPTIARRPLSTSRWNSNALRAISRCG